MNTLIPITPISLDGQTVNSVNGRDLHGFLQVGKDFSSWVKTQIARARLKENRDFIIFTQKGEYRKPLIEYAFTLDAGKHIAMMSGTDKGFMVRDYFIECERRANNPAHALAALPKADILRLAATVAEENEQLKAENKVLTPKAKALDRIATADGATCITNAAKSLQVRPKDLFALLSNKKWIYRRPGGKGWIGYQDKIQRGLLTHKVVTVSTSDGRDRVIESVLVTPKGITTLSNILTREAV